MSLTSNGLFNPMHRFGIHKSVLLSYSKDFQDRNKVECYVPTRNDVFRLPLNELEPILTHWFTQAPPELTPNDKQRKAVTDLLRLRKDGQKFNKLISQLEAMGRHDSVATT